MSLRLSSEVKVLLGAGASTALGFPAVGEIGPQAALDRLDGDAFRHHVPLVKNLEEYLRRSGGGGLEAAIERLRYYRNVVEAGIRDDNLAAAFGTTPQSEAARRLLHRGATELEPRLFKALHDIYAPLLPPDKKREKEQGTAALRLHDLFAWLAGQNPSCRLDMFTTNYDIAMDFVFPWDSTHVLVESEPFGVIQRRRLQSPQNASRRTTGRVTINLHRLHGCAAAVRRNHRGSRASPGPILQALPADISRTNWTQLAIKVGEDLEVLREEPFSSAYGRFKRGLDEGGLWVIIGYGFRDRAIAQRLYDAMGSPGVQLLVVDRYLTKKEILQRLATFPGARPCMGVRACAGNCTPFAARARGSFCHGRTNARHCPVTVVNKPIEEMDLQELSNCVKAYLRRVEDTHHGK